MIKRRYEVHQTEKIYENDTKAQKCLHVVVYRWTKLLIYNISHTVIQAHTQQIYVLIREQYRY